MADYKFADTLAIPPRWQPKTVDEAKNAGRPAVAVANAAAEIEAVAGAAMLAAPVSASELELLRAQNYVAACVEAQDAVVRVLKANGTSAEIESAQASYTLAVHQLNGVMRHLPAPARPPDLSLLVHGPIVAGAAAGAAGLAKNESDADFWGRISDAIGRLKSDYLGVYETAMEKNNDFQRDFTAIYSRMSEWQKGDDKNTTLKLEGTKKVPISDIELEELIVRTRKDKEDFNANMARLGMMTPLIPTDDASIRAELKSKGLDQKDVPDGLLYALKVLLQDYRDGPSTVFVSDQKTYYWTDEDEKAGRGKSGELITDEGVISERNKAIAEKWASATGLPTGGILKSVNDGITWLVKLDFLPVTKMIDSLEEMKKKYPLGADGILTLTTSLFQAWRQGFDGHADEIKNTSSVMAKKLVNAQSIYENLIKVLSSTIAAMLETCKLFLQN